MFTNSRRGMTLVELLTVIAIIAILAAIIFPAMAGAQRKARESKCMSNLMQIYTGMAAFQQDQHKYPEFIAGPVEYKYESGAIVYNQNVPSPNASDPAPDPANNIPALVPMEQSKGMIGNQVVALYPEYIKSSEGLKCPSNRLNGEKVEYNSSDVVQDPMFDHLATLALTTATRADARPSYMRDDTDPRYSATPIPYYVYCLSNYDYQVPPGTTNSEAHYSTIWSADPVGTVGLERQLRWRNPPEDTLVTWCSFHRSVNADGTVTNDSMDLVLFLDGRVKRIKSNGYEVWTDAWKTPAPK